MGLFNRPYWKESGDGPSAGGGMGLAFPRLTRGVKWLLIANGVAFVLQLFLDGPQTGEALTHVFGATAAAWWQVWRYATFQFLHDRIPHIFFNMLGLYFFGTMLEGLWGARRFVTFYLACGAVAGLAYVVIVLLALPGDILRPLVGASGGVYAIIMACVLLMPQARIIFFIFPMSLRTAGIIIFGVMVLMVLGAVGQAVKKPGAMASAMSDVAHLGGAVAAAVWVVGGPRLRRARAASAERHRRGSWERKLRERAEQQARVDAILGKVHEQGIASLSKSEKRELEDASRRQREEDRRISRM